MKTGFLPVVAGILLLVTSHSCRMSRFTPDHPGALSVVFGSGGGITGAITEYLLCENGQVFFRNSLNHQWEKRPHAKKQEVKGLLFRLSQLDWQTLALNAPGNMYYYVEYRNGDTVNRLTWGAVQPHNTVQDIYSGLNALVRVPSKKSSE